MKILGKTRNILATKGKVKTKYFKSKPQVKENNEIHVDEFCEKENTVRLKSNPIVSFKNRSHEYF